MSINDKFGTFHRDNPHVYAKLLELATQVFASGAKHYTINGLFERLRWHYQFDVRTDDVFKLSNNYRSRYARLLNAEPGFSGFFRTRPLRTA